MLLALAAVRRRCSAPNARPARTSSTPALHLNLRRIGSRISGAESGKVNSLGRTNPKSVKNNRVINSMAEQAFCRQTPLKRSLCANRGWPPLSHFGLSRHAQSIAALDNGGIRCVRRRRVYTPDHRFSRRDGIVRPKSALQPALAHASHSRAPKLSRCSPCRPMRWRVSSAACT